ncbi:MAG: polysaccharide biosynthesis/export family protein [Terracidiphilus sp.]
MSDSSHTSARSLRELWELLIRRRWLVGSLIGGMLLACLLYCLVAPNQYEASAKVALRTSPSSSLSLQAAEPLVSASILSAPVQQETLANVFRSDQLAWKVITGLKLYQTQGFMGRSLNRFADFHPEAPAVDAQAWLLERFERRLRVETVPRTLLIQIRFRCADAALSAHVVNALIRAYNQQDADARVQATSQASDWLQGQLKDLKASVDRDDQRLAAFQREHGLLSTPETMANGQRGESEHTSALLEIDELGRELVAAAGDRILREAQYRAASEGDPELVVASDPHLQAEGGDFADGQLQQIHARRSELEQEEAQLNIEHGPNFPSVVEIRGQLQDLDRQKTAEDARLVERFRSALQTAADREQLVRKNLEEATGEGMKANEAATEYAAMREQANANRELYVRVLEKSEEAGLAAGVQASNISVVDYARQPNKPVAPDLLLYMAITLFVSLWLAVGGALLLESIRPSAARVGLALLAVVLAGLSANAQAPTPSTSGLPSGVVRAPATQQGTKPPNPKEAPVVWNSPSEAGPLPMAGTQLGSPMPAPIGPGDYLDVSEYHTPEFHSAVRVSPSGVVMLPMIHEVKVEGLDEQAAARAIEAALVAQGMLRHPQVSVLVTSYAGQDVSVLGEVVHPGVYPYTLHHRLLDLISAASGLAPNAGRLVNIFHRDDARTPHPVVLDPSGTDTAADHNPELAPGDTVQVSRAGLVFVVGDVQRPGGFPVDPAQGLTVVQALSLAWGSLPNAANSKALLIREQKSGRTITMLDLKRMVHGQDPDQPVHDRDILFVPHSMAKELWNKTLESAIQSAVGVSIYAGLVYSQWHSIKTTSTSVANSATNSTGASTGTSTGTTTGTNTGTGNGSSTGTSTGTSSGTSDGTTSTTTTTITN